MAGIARVEGLMVDLQPKVRRTDAIQSFVSQETPIIRITDTDGVDRNGLLLHDRHGRPLGHGSSSSARSARPSSDAMPPWWRPIWRDLFFMTHATTVGAITSLALAAIDTRLVGPALPQGRAAAPRDGGRRQETRPALHDRRRLAAHRDRGPRRGCAAPRRRRASAAPRSRSAGRMSRGCRAARGGAGRRRRRLRDLHRRQPGLQRRRGDTPRAPLRGARHRLVRGAAAGRRPRRPCAAVAQSPRCRSRSARASTAELTSASTCSAAPARSFRSTSARIGGITPWLKTAHLAETFNVPSARTS